MGSDETRDTRRRHPVQMRSRATVEAIVEGAARVFRREGWDATTNRIALEAGVSIGSLYEYFPNKHALLLALAERHVELAEASIARALAVGAGTTELLAAIQGAVLESQRFPSHALSLVERQDAAGSELRARAEALRGKVLRTLAEHARGLGLSEPELRAEVVLEAIGELSARAMFNDPGRLDERARHYLMMAVSCLNPAQALRE